MRVVIVPEDGSVSVDGKGFGGLDLSFIDPTIHAVQWYGDRGEVEHKDPATGRMTENKTIQSLESFKPALDAWAVAKAVADEAAKAVRSVGEIPVTEV